MELIVVVAAAAAAAVVLEVIGIEVDSRIRQIERRDFVELSARRVSN